MRLLRKDKILLRRLGKGYYNEDGDWIEGGFIDEPLFCCIQPDFSGHKRYIEKAGVRSEDCLTIHTQTPLFTVNDLNETQADRLVYDGYVWEVQVAKHWTTLRRLSHYDVLAFRQDKDYQNGSA